MFTQSPRENHCTNRKIPLKPSHYTICHSGETLKEQAKSQSSPHTLNCVKSVCFWIRKLCTLSWSTRSKWMSFPIWFERSMSWATWYLAKQVKSEHKIYQTKEEQWKRNMLKQVVITLMIVYRWASALSFLFLTFSSCSFFNLIWTQGIEEQVMSTPHCSRAEILPINKWFIYGEIL